MRAVLGSHLVSFTAYQDDSSDKDDEESDSCRDDDGQKSRVADSFFRRRIIAGWFNRLSHAEVGCGMLRSRRAFVEVYENRLEARFGDLHDINHEDGNQQKSSEDEVNGLEPSAFLAAGRIRRRNVLVSFVVVVHRPIRA